MATAALAAAIFAVDTATTIDIAFATLYVVVVGLSARFFMARAVILVAAGCVVLTLLSYYLTPPGGPEYEGVVNTVISIVAIGGTAFLAVTGQSAEAAQRRRREEDWLAVFEHNPVMYFIVDPAGTVVSVNGFGATQLGYHVNELVGQSVLKVFPDSEHELVRRTLDTCVQQPGQSNTWEIKKVRKDGTTLWVRENAKAVRRAQGDVVVLIGCEDITERKRAEEALQESEQRFRALIEHAYDVVMLLDGGCCVAYASPSVERVLGYTPEELAGCNAVDLIHPDEIEDARRRFAGLADEPGGVLTAEYLLRPKNGRWVCTEIIATNLLHEPSVRAVVLNLSDISERNEAEQAWRESEQRFRDYAETASDLFWETGPDHRFTSLTQQSPELAGLGKRGLGITRWEFAADVDEEPEKWRAHRVALEAHQSFRGFTYRAVRPNGTPIYFSVSGKPVFNQEGGFLGYRGVATDVTDAVRAEQAEKALQTARVELAHMARVTTLGEMTASIAHEINQPLAAITTNAGAGLRWLGGDPPNLAEAREAFARVVKDASRASEVIGRIRALVSKAPLRLERIDINEVIREVITLTGSEMVLHGVTLRTRLADEAQVVCGDRVQLQQVILNLILNAVEAMSSGEKRELTIDTRNDGATCLVSVCDTGPGLDAADADRIFAPFFSTKPGGMGIGLSICRSIIESHEGRIWADPKDERGSTFQFRLPLRNEMPAEPADRSSLPAP